MKEILFLGTLIYVVILRVCFLTGLMKIDMGSVFLRLVDFFLYIFVDVFSFGSGDRGPFQI